MSTGICSKPNRDTSSAASSKVTQPRDLAFRPDDRLADLSRKDVDKLALPLTCQRGDTSEQRLSISPRGLAPGFESIVGRIDRGEQVALITFGRGTHKRAVV